MSIIVNSMWVFVFALKKCSYAAFGEQNKIDNYCKCQLVYSSLKLLDFTTEIRTFLFLCIFCEKYFVESKKNITFVAEFKNTMTMNDLALIFIYLFFCVFFGDDVLTPILIH